MVIRDICARCRREFSVREIRGGNPTMRSLMMLGMHSPVLCPRCGGWVYSVEDGKELPFEFIVSPSRILPAAVLSAIKIPLIWWVLALAISLPLPSSGKINLFAPWLGWYLGGAALLGFVFSWALAWSAAARDDVNGPHERGFPPPGEFAAYAPIFLLLAMISAVGFVYALPKLAGSNYPLRNGLIRGLAAVMAALVAIGSIARDVFRYGRKPIQRF